MRIEKRGADVCSRKTVTTIVLAPNSTICVIEKCASRIIQVVVLIR